MNALILGVLFGAAGLLLFLASRSFFRVEEGQVAVVTRFGAARRDGNKSLLTFGPGLHRKLPIDEVVTAPAIERALELAGENGGVWAMTPDRTLVRVDARLRVTTDLSALDTYLFGVAKPEAHAQAMFSALLRNEVAQLPPNTDDAVDIGDYARLRRDRRPLLGAIQRFLKTDIGDRTGVRFGGFDVVHIQAPEELQVALDLVFESDAKAGTELSRAKAEAERRLLSAEHGVKVAETRAKAVADDVRTMLEALEKLDKEGALETYVARRKDEVYADANLTILSAV